MLYPKSRYILAKYFPSPSSFFSSKITTFHQSYRHLPTAWHCTEELVGNLMWIRYIISDEADMHSFLYSLSLNLSCKVRML